ncbi:universal stress protein [Pseudonocardia sp. GCM10023141]|uniref:universal stress protein n=1 Tax=Pseudonocardia sp. GCM10023141 TaxID=3252653 RepID=UPI00361B19A4
MRAQGDGCRVVVGVDGSPEAPAAVRWAAAEAVHHRIPLRLVSAFDWPGSHVVARPKPGAATRDVLMRRARALLDVATAAARCSAPDLEVEQHLAVGTLAAALVSESRRARLVVVAAPASIRSVVTHARCPVVVWHGADRAGAETAPVVVGVDGGPDGDAAIAFAFEAAAVRGASLIGVQAHGRRFGAVRTRAGHAPANDRFARWTERYPGVELQRISSPDRPVQELLELSGDAQLIVVGSRGCGALAGVVAGSVSKALTRRARCPVAVIGPAALSHA